MVTGAQSPGCLALPAATPVATLFPQQSLRFQGAVSGLKTSVLREYRQVLRRGVLACTDLTSRISIPAPREGQRGSHSGRGFFANEVVGMVSGRLQL